MFFITFSLSATQKKITLGFSYAIAPTPFDACYAG